MSSFQRTSVSAPVHAAPCNQGDIFVSGRRRSVRRRGTRAESYFPRLGCLDNATGKISCRVYGGWPVEQGASEDFSGLPTGRNKSQRHLYFVRTNRLRQNDGQLEVCPPSCSMQSPQTHHLRLEKIFDAACRNQILEHHSNLEISDDSTSPNDEYEQHKLLTARWENPVILTTMVQFLETIYSNRAASLRKFHNMADAVLVFDEVQALPIKCTYLFNDAINYLHYCGGSSVLLCTATQPQLDRVSRPIKYSPNHALVTLSDAERAVFKRVHIANQSLTPFSFVDIARLAGKEIKAGKSTLVILNTKQSATEVYRLCKTSISNCRTFLLTTNLCPAHRKHQLAQITNRAKDERILCVSTQLIEAGVDLSFDCVSVMEKIRRPKLFTSSMPWKRNSPGLLKLPMARK